MEDQEPLEATEDHGVISRMRDLPVGVADPNIIGDAGPTDVPPGTDPPERAGDEVGLEDGDDAALP